MISYQKAYFLLSVAQLDQLPPDRGAEIAIVGRSNAGKSSILNRIAQQHKLARVSKLPGRTQLINFFAFDARHRIVDLPGYGYARVALAVKRHWETIVPEYLAQRKTLKGLLLVMDIRHAWRQQDANLVDYCWQRSLPVHILLNKCDKLAHNERRKIEREINNILIQNQYDELVTVQLFSAVSNYGLTDLHNKLTLWYSINY